MEPIDALRAATSTAARVLRRDDIGVIREAARADIIAVSGDPLRDIAMLRNVIMVLRDGNAVR